MVKIGPEHGEKSKKLQDTRCPYEEQLGQYMTLGSWWLGGRAYHTTATKHQPHDGYRENSKYLIGALRNIHDCQTQGAMYQ